MTVLRAPEELEHAPQLKIHAKPSYELIGTLSGWCKLVQVWCKLVQVFFPTDCKSQPMAHQVEYLAHVWKLVIISKPELLE